MTYIKKLLLLALLSTSLFGCLQVNTKVNVKKDGSGTIEETVLIKNEIINMLKEFAMAFDSTKKDDFSLFNEDEMKNKASGYGEGVKYKSSEKIKKSGFDGYKVIYSFKDINKVKLNLNPDDKLPMGESSDDEVEGNAEYVNFKFIKGSPSVLTIIFPEEKMEKEMESEAVEMSDSAMSDQVDKMIEMFDGMKISFNLFVDGDMQETDASYVDGNKVTIMDIDFAELIKNKDVLMTLEKSNNMTRAGFKEMTASIPGIKLEAKEKIIIKIR